MARIDNINNFLTDVADSIRTKTGKSGKISASSFDTEIASITTSEDLDSELAAYNTELTEQEESLSGIVEYLENKIESGEPLLLQDKSIEITENGTTTITADSGYDGLNSLEVTTNIESSVGYGKLYIIKDGVEQTSVTGGGTIIKYAGVVSDGIHVEQDNESFNLYAGLWQGAVYRFNNGINMNKHKYLCIDYSFPSTSNKKWLKSIESSVQFKTTDGASEVTLLSGNTTNRTVVKAPLENLSSNEVIQVQFVNLSATNGEDNESAYDPSCPLSIYNMWLEESVLLQDKSVEITKNGVQTITADEDYEGLNSVKVTVNVEGTGGNSTQPRYLYLIKDGVEQTDITGGSTFEYVPNSGNPNCLGTTFKGDGYLGMCAQVWSFYSLMFNNTFDYKTYSRIYVEWAYPKTSSPSAMYNSQVALRTSISPIRTFLTYNEGAKARTISTLDLSTATEEDQIRLIVGNIGDGDNYTNYPAQIFNLYLENPNVAQEYYLTDEIKIGRTWIDDKPIYRKVFTGNFPTITHDYNTYTTVKFDISDLNISNVVALDGTINQDNGYAHWTLNWYHSIVGASARSYITNDDNGNWLVVSTNCNWLSGNPIVAILEYTKTTD